LPEIEIQGEAVVLRGLALTAVLLRVRLPLPLNNHTALKPEYEQVAAAVAFPQALDRSIDTVVETGELGGEPLFEILSCLQVLKSGSVVWHEVGAKPALEPYLPQRLCFHAFPVSAEQAVSWTGEELWM